MIILDKSMNNSTCRQRDDSEAISTLSRPQSSITLGEALPVWARIAALSFGGPAGQIAVMHRVLVEEKRWISENRFLHALNFCTLLPGPEAQQLAAYIGWLMHGTRGGVIAGGLFVLPGVLAIMALSWIYVLYGNVGIIAGLYFGLKAAVLAIVAEAVLRIGRRALKGQAMVALAATAFVAIFFFDVPFPIIILMAGIIGFYGGRAGLSQFRGSGHGAAHKDDGGPYLLGDDELPRERATLGATLRTLGVWLAIWLLPVAAVLLTVGTDDVFANIAVFFSKMAMVTFGGAYAVLSYVAQQAVEHYGWLKPGEMLDGLGMAEEILPVLLARWKSAYRILTGTAPIELRRRRIFTRKYAGFVGICCNSKSQPCPATVISCPRSHLPYIENSRYETSIPF